MNTKHIDKKFLGRDESPEDLEVVKSEGSILQDARGKKYIKGLAIGIELEGSGYAAKIGERCRESGFLLSASESSLSLFPALNISPAIAARGLDRLEQSL